jgi:glutamate racemase
VDTLVLGCTHYPFILPTLARLAGPQVTIIDPAPAVARQTGRLLAYHRLMNNGNTPGAVQMLTTGDHGRFVGQVARLGPEPHSVARVALPAVD